MYNYYLKNGKKISNKQFVLLSKNNTLQGDFIYNKYCLCIAYRKKRELTEFEKVIKSGRF